MKEAVEALTKFFESDIWSQACRDTNQPMVHEGGIEEHQTTIMGEKVTIGMDFNINLALDFEGKFNEMRHTYMRYRKEQGLKHDD